MINIMITCILGSLNNIFSYPISELLKYYIILHAAVNHYHLSHFQKRSCFDLIIIDVLIIIISDYTDNVKL